MEWGPPWTHSLTETMKIQGKIQYIPYIWTFKLRTFKDAKVHLVPARNQNLCHQRQKWVKWQLALHLLLLMILQLYHLPPPLPPPVSNSSCLFTWCQPLYAQLLYCTTVLFKVLYCKIKKFSLFFVCFLCIICVKSITNHCSTVMAMPTV